MRGHSNVQGQRTVGIAEKAHLVPLDRLAEMFHFTPPRKDRMAIVDAVKGLIDGKIKAFVSLGETFCAPCRISGGWSSPGPRRTLR